MAKKKNKTYTIGCELWQRKAVAKPLIEMVISIQNSEKSKKKCKGRKPSFVWASYELANRIKKNEIK